MNEAPPTYREVVIYDAGRHKWVFDPHWLRWLLDLGKTSDATQFGLRSPSQANGAYPAFAVRAGTGMTVTQDALGFTLNTTVSSVDIADNILANRVFGG